jgi:hypothetical protein
MTFPPVLNNLKTLNEKNAKLKNITTYPVLALIVVAAT